MALADKPLPKVPSKDSGAHARLTIESRAHLKEFIRYSLTEEKVDGAAEWAKGIELALKELVDSVSRGGWLAGFKRARRMDMLRRNEKEKERKGLERERREREEDAKDGKKAKSRIIEDKSVDRRNDDPPPRKESLKSSEERRRAALEQLHSVVASPLPPSPKISPRHLLLTLSPKGAVLPSRDMDFDIIPSNKLCVFTADKYSLPSLEEWDRGVGSMILFGLDEWSGESIASVNVVHILRLCLKVDSQAERPKLVGGTFSFTGISSTAQMQTLGKVLRLSVFMLLSLALEQSLLTNSHVELHYPPLLEAQPLHFSFTSPDVPARQVPAKSKSLRAAAASGIWSFLTKRTEGFLGRSSSALVASSSSAYSRTKSLDPYATLTPEAPAAPVAPTRTSRRLSLTLSGARPDNSNTKHDEDATFANILARVKSVSPVLSTSTDVNFPAPRVLCNLADKEGKDPGRKLLGDERVSLTSLLGWEGRENRGRGMTGLVGFVRHQGITFLYAEYVPQKETTGEGKGTLVSSSFSRTDNRDNDSKLTSQMASSPSEYTPATLVPCIRGRLVTYRYYMWSLHSQNRTSDPDRSLGEAIESFCAVDDPAEVKCENLPCKADKIEHRRMWIHGGLRITAELRKEETGEGAEQDISSSLASLAGPVFMWASCEVCKKQTERKKMSDGT